MAPRREKTSQDQSQCINVHPTFGWTLPFAGRTVVSIITPDGSVACVDDVCRDFEEGEESLIEGFDDLLTGTEVVSESEREIAGRSAFCFNVEATREINFETGEVCFDESGIPLLLEGHDAEGDGGLEAREVSEDVPSEVFERPD